MDGQPKRVEVERVWASFVRLWIFDAGVTTYQKEYCDMNKKAETLPKGNDTATPASLSYQNDSSILVTTKIKSG